MAWNPSPKVAACRDAAAKFGASKVIMIMFNEQKGTMEAISYGRTRLECDEAKELARVAFEAVYDHLDSLEVPEVRQGA